MKQGIVFRMAIGRSKWLLSYLILVHIVMAITVISLQLESEWYFLLIAILLLSFISCCRREQWTINTSPKNQIERDESGLWHLGDMKGRKLPNLALKNSFVTINLVILYLSSGHSWRQSVVVIFADAVDKDLFRQLRVYLRDPKTFPL